MIRGDLKTLLAQRVLVPLYERRWGIYPGPTLAALERSQFDAPERIREQQWKQVQSLVEFASRSNPFYRQRFSAAGFEPGDLQGWGDFESLALLTKDDIRSHPGELISDGYARETMRHCRTGGSTGVPVHLYWDRAAHHFKNALVKRHDAWAGYRLGAKQAALWGDTDKDYPLNVRLYKALCERTIFLDTLKMDDAYLGEFVQRIRRFGPKILIGHAHSIYFFTEFLRAERIEDIRFDGIISTAETLIPAERERIESYFGAIVFDRYGCEEVSLIASECAQHDGLHIGAEGLYVEVLDGDESTPGRIVVTDLINRGMPFIRYEVGDLATVARGVCPCGRGLPRLGRVHGRTSDILFAPDGRAISGISILDTFIIHVAGVRQAQLVQDALDHIRVRVVGGAGFGDATVQELHRAVAKVFGPAMRCDVETVEVIAPSARGKYQFSICQLDPLKLSPPK